MTAKDRFTVNLACPKCQTSGIANLWQEDGWSFSNGDMSTHIESVPGGFRAEQHGPKAKFFCSNCGAAV